MQRILIVDDERGSARLLGANLELTGNYQVCIETDAERALATARRFQPHLLILDAALPKCSGAQIVTLLRQDPAFQSLPILFLTAAPQRVAEPDTLPFTQDIPCIAKPAGMEEILKFLQQMLPPEPGTDHPDEALYRRVP